MTAGQRAYAAYCACYPGPARDMAIPWEKLPSEIKTCWEMAAAAARAHA